MVVPFKVGGMLLGGVGGWIMRYQRGLTGVLLVVVVVGDRVSGQQYESRGGSRATEVCCWPDIRSTMRGGNRYHMENFPKM